MLLRLLLTVVLVSTVAASVQAQTGRDAGISSIADLDSAVHKVLSPTPQESREAIDWLVRQGDRSSIAVLIQLLRWLPEHRDVVEARLEALTGAYVGPYWFDWMVAARPSGLSSLPGLCRVSGGSARSDRSAIQAFRLRWDRPRNPHGGDRLGRRARRRHPSAGQSQDDNRLRCELPERGRSGLWRRDQWRRPRLSAADRELARDSQRRGRRCPGQPRLLHIVRVRYLV